MYYLIDLSKRPAIVVHSSDDESELETVRAKYKAHSGAALAHLGIASPPVPVLAVMEGPTLEEQLAQDAYDERLRVNAIAEAARAQTIEAAAEDAKAKADEAQSAIDHYKRLKAEVTPIKTS
jgi:hypothetical protein